MKRSNFFKVVGIMAVGLAVKPRVFMEIWSKPVTTEIPAWAMNSTKVGSNSIRADLMYTDPVLLVRTRLGREE